MVYPSQSFSPNFAGATNYGYPTQNASPSMNYPAQQNGYTPGYNSLGYNQGQNTGYPVQTANNGFPQNGFSSNNSSVNPTMIGGNVTINNVTNYSVNNQISGPIMTGNQGPIFAGNQGPVINNTPTYGQFPQQNAQADMGGMPQQQTMPYTPQMQPSYPMMSAQQSMPYQMASAQPMNMQPMGFGQSYPQPAYSMGGQNYQQQQDNSQLFQGMMQLMNMFMSVVGNLLGGSNAAQAADATSSNSTDTSADKSKTSAKPKVEDKKPAAKPKPKPSAPAHHATPPKNKGTISSADLFKKHAADIEKAEGAAAVEFMKKHGDTMNVSLRKIYDSMQSEARKNAQAKIIAAAKKDGYTVK